MIQITREITFSSGKQIVLTSEEYEELKLELLKDHNNIVIPTPATPGNPWSWPGTSAPYPWNSQPITYCMAH